MVKEVKKMDYKVTARRFLCNLIIKRRKKVLQQCFKKIDFKRKFLILKKKNWKS